jgi:hypothetical protein
MKTLLRNACVDQPVYQLDTAYEVIYRDFEVTYHFYEVPMTNHAWVFMLSTTIQRQIGSRPKERLKFAAFYRDRMTLCSAATAERPKLPSHNVPSGGRWKHLKFRALSQRRRLCSAQDAGRPKLPNYGFCHRPPGRRIATRSKSVAGTTTNIHFRYRTRGVKSSKSRLNTMPKLKRFRIRVKKTPSNVEVVTLESSGDIANSRPSTSTQPIPSTSRSGASSKKRPAPPATSSSSDSSVSPRYLPFSPTSSRNDSDSTRKSRRVKPRPRSYLRSRSRSSRSPRTSKNHIKSRRSPPANSSRSTSPPNLSEPQERETSNDHDHTLQSIVIGK